MQSVVIVTHRGGSRNQTTKNMIQDLINVGEFNGWKGCVALYFTVKKQRELKKAFGITGQMMMSEVKSMLNL